MARIKANAWFPVLLLLASLAPAPAVAADRTLLTIESSPKGVVLEVLETAGAQFAESVVPAPAWRLKPGEPVSGDTRPADRVVEIYTGTPQTPSLLCRVVLRHYRSDAGWTPHFRLEEEPLVARVNGRWQPLDPARGMVGLVRLGSTLPNAEGFFPTIEFGLGGGMLPIVAWQVR